MVSHQLATDGTKRFLDRRHLGEDVGAVAVLIHHFLQPANLPLDAAKSLQVS
jgi:hypothetical protein